jgi:hypothetical protein
MNRILCAAPLVWLAACTDVTSDSVLTSGMYAQMGVRANGTGQATASAVLTVGGNSTTYVELTEGDALTVAVADADPVPLVEVELFDYHGYEAVLDGDSTDPDYTIAFTRTVDAGAPSTVIHLPDGFTPAEPADSSRADGVALLWDGGSDDDMAVHAEGDCVVPYDHVLDSDTGSFTIDAGDLVAVSGQEAESCAVEVTLTRSRPGTLDPAFGEGGTALGTQVRTVSFTSSP